MDKAQQDALKKAAGIEAAKLIQNGMIAGLGTGSTVRFLVDELGRRVQEEGLEFTGVTTSRRTQEQAEGYGIKIVDIDDVDHIDVTIDGADEVDKNFNGIKGGGAALLWEKIVATNSNKIVWIVDESKVVDTIGKFRSAQARSSRSSNPAATSRCFASTPKASRCAPTRTTTWSICTSNASNTRRLWPTISSTPLAWWSMACSCTWWTRSSWAIPTVRACSPTPTSEFEVA